MKIGYARVSTADQNEARQLAALKEHGVEKIFLDKQSGKDTNRPELRKLLDFCREDDTIIVESISRIARSVADLLRIMDLLKDKGTDFVSLKESIDTSTPQGRFMLTVFGALAELERENILQRQREGIEIAKANGRYKGRAPIKVDDKAFSSICKRWSAGELTAVEAARQAGLSKSTFYRRIRNGNV